MRAANFYWFTFTHFNYEAETNKPFVVQAEENEALTSRKQT
jgi:hypothetical protein